VCVIYDEAYHISNRSLPSMRESKRIYYPRRRGENTPLYLQGEEKHYPKKKKKKKQHTHGKNLVGKQLAVCLIVASVIGRRGSLRKMGAMEILSKGGDSQNIPV